MLILIEVGVGDHACDVLAVEVVVGGVDVPDAPVGVVIAVGAGTERSLSPDRRSAPVIVVVTEMIKIDVKSPNDLYLKQFILTSAMQWSCFLLVSAGDSSFLLRSFSIILFSFRSLRSPDLPTRRLSCGGQEHLDFSLERVSSTTLLGLASSTGTPTAGLRILRYFLGKYEVKSTINQRCLT